MNSYVAFRKLFSYISKKQICVWHKFNLSNLAPETGISIPSYFSFSNNFINFSDIENILNSMIIYNDFLNEYEERSLMDELDPYMKKLRYEFDHWDDAIHGYRETERLNWNEENTRVLNRVKSVAFPPNVAPLRFVHILDLDKNGWIKPHIDAVRFCGDTIAGLSLLTDSIMRLVHDKNKGLIVDIYLKRKSLYVMKGAARYDYTHEILSNEGSIFKGKRIIKDRRISVICRNEPSNKTEK